MLLPNLMLDALALIMRLDREPQGPRGLLAASGEPSSRQVASRAACFYFDAAGRCRHPYGETCTADVDSTVLKRIIGCRRAYLKHLLSF
jgi:hypothetical protein